MDRSRVALVIPALNEARSIVDVVSRARSRGVPIVVDDGSRDDTAKLAKAAGAEVVTHAHNQGYDAALNSGFRRAAELELDVAITLDADGQHDPSVLEEFIAELDRGADVVVGIRDRHQRIAERLFAWYARRVWGLSDPLCGLKAYRLRVYEAQGYFDSCSSIGTELAVFAVVRGFDVRQVPIVIGQRRDQPRFGRSIRGNVRILRALLVVAMKAHDRRRQRRAA